MRSELLKFLMLVLGFALAACDGGDSSNSLSSAMSAKAEALCVKTINDYRKTLNLSELSAWSDQNSCSAEEAKNDFESNQAHAHFGSCGESAQNECPAWPGPAEQMIAPCLGAMWSEGPGADFSSHGHYLNMSSTQFTQVSCGFYTTSDGRVWSVQNFR